MNLINSVRIKMMAPIVVLAVILIGLFIFSYVVSKMQSDALNIQSERYFEAISEVLNADRDIYQARLAQQMLYSGQGSEEANREDFQSNAEQVRDRFNNYRRYLESEPELLTEFNNFDGLYQEWLDASEKLLASSKANLFVTSEFRVLDEKFMTIRNMLDIAGEELRQYTRTMTAYANTDEVNRSIEAVVEVLNADRDLYQARLALQQYMDGASSKDEALKFFDENVAQVMLRFNIYRENLSDIPHLTKNYTQFDNLFNQWVTDSRVFFTSPEMGKKSELPADMMLANEKFSAIRSVLDKAGESVRNHARSVEQRMEKQIDGYQSFAVVVILVAFAAALIFGFVVTQRLTHTVQTMAARIREIAEGDGDLTQRIHSSRKDELGEMANEFDKFVEHLRGLISQIRSRSAELGSMTDGLNQTSEQTEKITRSLADASDSIVSAGHEMSMSNRQMAETADNTAQEANNSDQLTQQGINAVSTSQHAISGLVKDIENALGQSKEVESSSEAIASVLEVIRNIAEQTNLLALNAAIEAARAGEQGRGFAVVADEVRTLATRTQDSTDEIESMINQLRNSVQNSSGAIQNSRSNAQATAENFDKVTDIFNALSKSFSSVQKMAQETAQATREQSDASENISENLVAMKSETDHVKDVSAKIKSRAHEINEVYKGMDKLVGSFKV
ncbi:MAG: chemotaxis protein [Oleibacter sp.]|nr:chemotaxis protein [Thalassolituus sp.]|tara:strand:- start:463 stop:2496 length:2034 start_codon:yes stop_codon:yes gene_type:complete